MSDIRVGTIVRVADNPFSRTCAAAGKTFKIVKIAGSMYGIDLPNPYNSDVWYFFADDLVVVRQVPSIRTEKIMIGSDKCRKILGFNNMEGIRIIPDTRDFYLEYCASPFNNIRIWDCKKGRYTWGEELAKDAFINIHYPGDDNLFRSLTGLLFIGDVIREDNFQEIITWISRILYLDYCENIRNKPDKSQWFGTDIVEI